MNMMAHETIFDFEDYKTFLKSVIAQMPKKGRGFRTELAQGLRCQSAYISQVLNGSAHFNAEQGLAVSRLLGLGEDESRLFILLIQRDRSGTHEFKNFIQKQIEELKSKRISIRERFRAKADMSIEDKLTYYSEWYYAAIHILTSVPRFQTPSAISQALQLPMGSVQRALELLTRCQMVKTVGSKYQMAEARIHLGSDSPLISKHHTNWRLQALQSLDRDADRDLHYTSVVSLSSEDVLKLKALLIEAMDRYNQIVTPSLEEELHCLAVDFFRVTEK